MSSFGFLYHNYIKTLASNDSERYLNKILMCDNQDPYELPLKEVKNDQNNLPNVSREDLVQYLVLTTEFYTLKQLKCQKALEAHNYLTSGWVKMVASKSISSNKVIVIGKVNHSQQPGEAPLRCWLLARKCGEVITAHCECMAGLGGACSHVGAVLFYLEVSNIKRSSTTCTSKENSWLAPTCGEVPITEVRECDFSSSEKRYKLMRGECSTPSPKRAVSFKKEWYSCDAEVSNFLTNLEKDYPDCAVFRVYPMLYEKHVTKSAEISEDNLPKPLTTLFQEEYSVLSGQSLWDVCDNVSEELKITEQQSVALEEATKEQRSSPLWQVHRAGHVSASLMRDALHTNILDPSVSLIKRICYPTQNNGKSVAMQYGIDMEKTSLDDYVTLMSATHEDFEVLPAGYFVRPAYPHIGGSPDGVTRCLCCGVGLVEFKNTLNNNDENVCGLQNGKLDRSHKYFYQVQTQMFPISK